MCRFEKTVFWRLSVCLVYCLLSCQSIGRKDIPQSRIYSTNFGYQVEIEQLENGLWRATYQLEEPVTEVRFYPLTNQIRKDLFQLETSGISWKDNDETIVFPSPSRTFIITHKTMAENFNQGYEFHNPINGQGMLFYLGYYNLYSFRSTAEPRDYFRHAEFSVNSPEAEYILVGDKLQEGNSGQYSSPTNNPNIFAFISEKPLPENGHDDVQSGPYNLIMNQDLPGNVRSDAEAKIKFTFETFNEKLFTLPEKHWVFMQIAFENPSISVGGGVLPGFPLAQMDIDSKALEGLPMENLSEEDQHIAFYFDHLIFHEVGHLWNVNSEEEWIWESMAEAQAYFSILEYYNRSLEEPSSRWLLAIQNNYEKCLDGLAYGKKYAITHRQVSDFYYGCGHMFQLTLMKELGGIDAFYTFWSKLYTAAEQSQSPVTLESIREALGEQNLSISSEMFSIQIDTKLRDMHQHKNRVDEILTALEVPIYPQPLPELGGDDIPVPIPVKHSCLVKTEAGQNQFCWEFEFLSDQDLAFTCQEGWSFKQSPCPAEGLIDQRCRLTEVYSLLAYSTGLPPGFDFENYCQSTQGVLENL